MITISANEKLPAAAGSDFTAICSHFFVGYTSWVAAHQYQKPH